MCIIINKPAGVTMDFEEFATCVENNPHGFGFATPGEFEGQLFVQRSSIEPDPEYLYRMMFEEYDEQSCMLHLRYTTAGETIVRNSHPFPILELESDGIDLRMAHNGTIHKYKPAYAATNKWESDTRVFVREYVRPLMKRLIRGIDIEEIMTDPFVTDVLEDILPGASVLSFIDGNGQTYEFNALGNGGEYREDGLYLSNAYSLKKGHRAPKNNQVVPFQGQTNHSTGTHWKNGNGTGSTVLGTPSEIEGFSRSWAQGDTQVYRQGPYGWGYYVAGFDDDAAHKKISESETKAKIVGLKDSEVAQSTGTQLFSDKYDLRSAHEVFTLTDQTLQKIRDEEPDDLVLLVKEMSYRQQGLLRAMGKTKEDYEERLKNQREAITDLRAELKGVG